MNLLYIKNAPLFTSYLKFTYFQIEYPSPDALQKEQENTPTVKTSKAVPRYASIQYVCLFKPLIIDVKICTSCIDTLYPNSFARSVYFACV